MQIFAIGIERGYRFWSQFERLPIYIYVIAELVKDPREDGLLEVAKGANIIAPHIKPN
jgi:hypothetical protein